VKMKTNKRLKLSRETLRTLEVVELKTLGGGVATDGCSYTNYCTTSLDTCTTQRTSHNTCGSAYC